MKARILFSFMAILFAIAALLTVNSCKKDEEDDNKTSNSPPTASFQVSPSSGTTETHFEFDASACSDEEDATSTLEVRWDWENDGVWDTDWSSNKTINHKYLSEGEYTVAMEVKDSEGLTGYTTQTITVNNGSGGNGCDGQTTLTYGGQTYDLVEIGDQCWMAENLNYETGNSWCFDNDPSNCETYGRLYDWSTALGACPSGWHLPGNNEWDIIINHLGGSDVAGGKMKEAGTAHWNSPNTGATNESGFTALPGGRRYGGSMFDELGYYSYWWTSTEAGSTRAWIWSMYYNNAGVYRLNYGTKSDGFSVRCLKD